MHHRRHIACDIASRSQGRRPLSVRTTCHARRQGRAGASSQRSGTTPRQVKQRQQTNEDALLQLAAGRVASQQQQRQGPSRQPGTRQGQRPPSRTEQLAEETSKRALQLAQLRQMMQDPERQEARRELVPFADLVKQRGATRSTDADSGGGEDEEDNAATPAAKGRGRGSKKAAARQLLEQYYQVFKAALQLELQEEWDASEARLRSWSRQRLEEEGCALFDMTAKPAGALYRDTVLHFVPPQQTMPFHSFSQGDMVVISKGSPRPDESIEGVVMDCSASWIRLAVSCLQAAAVQGPGWRVDQYASTTSYERSMAALQQFCRPPALPGGADPDAPSSPTRDLLRVLAGLASGQDLERMSSQAPPWTRGNPGRERLAAARKLLASLKARLNPSQRLAVEAALTRTVTLWQGPPGTGKTTTLLQYIRAVLVTLPPRGRVLAAAASNVAVDNLVLGLVGLGVKIVRVGQPAKVTPELWGVTLAARVEAHPLGAAARKLTEGVRGLSGPKAREVWERARKMEAEAALEVLQGADVVAATCIGAGDPLLEEVDFAACVVDEATQATEPHVLVPIMRKAQSLLLVGDPQQLPPTVKSREAQTLGLATPLFARLQAMGIPPLLLTSQYRMHPDIASFPSAAFYGSRLQSVPAPADRPPVPGFAWPNPQVPVAMLVVTGYEARTSVGGRPLVLKGRAAAGFTSQPASERGRGGGKGQPPESGGGRTGVSRSMDEEDDGRSVESAGGFSYSNAEEAAAVVRLVEGVVRAGGLPDLAAIGVITPYSGQVRALNEAFSRVWKDRQQLQQLEIRTVDGFQGREKELIVFSAVRSNPRGAVGFLRDHRRLNVALTRARRGLVVVGNSTTLAADPVWAQWLRWVRERGLECNAATLP